ncbi:hemerythrin domain-containing protein [Bdellovibrio sp. 22V]|uniref:hemerythrin domain-containing protein n=1 Tax=Bdellovibrio TaxID=958 RepID=UPI002543EC14|nr:hemerythrin domain-containing protein [Bdellovibrio sp. 22V]WII71479.1 hemerythrin domain-containing protein [Bdellovibrio sp. 22V]
MEIYEALRKDHDTIKQLFRDLLSLRDDDTKNRKALIEQIRDELIPHARAEETVFYNSLRELKLTKELAVDGYREHIEAEALLRLMQLQDKANMDWKATAAKLQQALEHHIQEEETRFFEAARSNFTREEAEMFAAAFEKLKPKIREQSIMGTTLDMVANMMPPRFSGIFRNGSPPI